MKPFFIFLLFFFCIIFIYPQDTHTYGPVRDQNWYTKAQGTSPLQGDHSIGVNAGGPIINYICFVNWQWNNNDIPQEATLTSINIKFNAVRVNYVQSNLHFTLHWIESDWDNINIDYYSNQVQYNNNRKVYEDNRTSNSSGHVSYDATITSGDLFNHINNAITNPDYYMTLAIRSEDGDAPWWDIYPIDGDQSQSDQPSIDITFNFTTPTQTFTFYNKFGSNESYGDLVLNNDYLHPFVSGTPKHPSWNSPNTVRTDELPFVYNWNQTGTTQKHLFWSRYNFEDDYILNKDFQANELSPVTMKANFYPTSSSTISNSLEGTSANSGQINFIDPFYYHKIAVNWYQSNEPKTYDSPFIIDNNSQNSYGGIFLDQEIGSDAYYSIQAISPQSIPLDGLIGTRNFYFKGWSGTNITFQNSSSSTTGLVFNSNNSSAVANLKGQGLSNDQAGYSSTSQRKFVKTSDGKLHYIYSSMGHVWYEISSNGGSTWQIANGGNYIDNGEGKLPSIYQFPSNSPLPCVLIAYQEKNGSSYKIKVKTFSNGTIQDNEEILVSESYDTDAIPVVAISGNEPYIRFLVIFKKTTALYYRFGILSGDGIIDWAYPAQTVIVNGTGSNSCNPTIVGRGFDVSSGHFYLAWEDYSQIKYKAIFYNNQNQITDPSSIEYSYNSGFRFNYLPSISLTGSTYSPIISWVGHNGIDITKVITKRGTTGNFQILGNNVNNVNNNSTSESTENTVIIWSEGNPAVSKWVKRMGTNYSSTANLSRSGIQTQVSNGSDLTAIKAMVYNVQTAPYYFILDNDNFDGLPHLEKITDDNFSLTYGRSGIVGKNGVNFVFNIGDIILADTNVQFIPRPDTLLYTNTDELNQVTRSLTFHLDNQSELYFTNFYYTVNSEMADTVLTDEDAVTFKAELVNANSNEVTGIFDQITYTKENLDKYNNINYQVDCSGIEEGDYYLRLVTSVEGDASYNLANVQNDNPGLAKRSYKNINYTGKEAPITYDLAQNYPNPFNPATTINYQVPENSFVTLKVYDILGRKVATLVNEQKTQGKYSVKFEATRLASGVSAGGGYASGVYIYQIRANDFVSSKKMILLK